MAETIIVQINYIDGTSETVEAIEGLEIGIPNKLYAYNYYHSDELFCVCKGKYCMMIPREFVKSIKVIEVE